MTNEHIPALSWWYWACSILALAINLWINDFQHIDPIPALISGWLSLLAMLNYRAILRHLRGEDK